MKIRASPMYVTKLQWEYLNGSFISGMVLLHIVKQVLKEKTLHV